MHKQVLECIFLIELDTDVLQTEKQNGWQLVLFALSNRKNIEQRKENNQNTLKSMSKSIH